MTEDKTEGRRKAITTGALASSAVALGLGASGTAAAQQVGSALVFTYDYSPRRSFQQVSRIQQSTTNSILTDVVNQPDEWTGFIGRYRRGENDPGEFFLAFTRGGGLGSGEFSTDATFFAPEANLLRVELIEVEEETTTPPEEEETTTPAEEEETTTPAEEEETTTPAEETTEEVVVETTTTETNGG